MGSDKSMLIYRCRCDACQALKVELYVCVEGCERVCACVDKTEWFEVRVELFRCLWRSVGVCGCRCVVEVRVE